MGALDGYRFNALRLFAAFLVLLSHSFPLHGLPLPVPVPGHSLGSIAVALFFVVSGFLISKSWVNDPDVGRYWVRRLLRIYPGLVVAVELTTLLIGSLFTTLSLGEFWSHPATWSYVVNNVSAIAGQHTLPGVFEHNPFANAFNASLWTLRYELLMYLLFALLGWVVGAKRLTAGVVAVFCALAVYRLGVMVQAVGEPAQAFEGWFSLHFSLKDTLEFAYFFFAGAVMNVLNLKRVHPLVILVLAVITVAGLSATWRVLGLSLLIPLGVLFVARQVAAVAAWEGFDGSYGLYIYAFPIQQACVQVVRQWEGGWWQSFASSLVLTALCAWASWRWVEAPMLKFKRGRHGSASAAR